MNDAILIQQHLINKLKEFKPSNIDSLNAFMSKFYNSDFQEILCIYQRTQSLKRQYEAYKKAADELNELIPGLSIASSQ